MGGGDAEPTELDGDRRSEVAGGLERVDRLERVGPVAVVLGGAGGELPGELLGDGDEAGAGFGMGCEFDWLANSPIRSSSTRGRSLAPSTGLMRALGGGYVDGDGHAVGDHVVDG